MIAGVVLGTIIFLLICAGAVLLVYAYFNPTSTTGEVIKVNYKKLCNFESCLLIFC